MVWKVRLTRELEMHAQTVINGGPLAIDIQRQRE